MKKYIAVLGLLVLSACGSGGPVVTGIVNPVYTQPIVFNNNGINTYVVVKRGYFTGCRGYITNYYFRFNYGYYYNVGTLYCPNLMFNDIWLHQSVL